MQMKKFNHLNYITQFNLVTEMRPEGRFYLLPNGNYVPSVTTVLDYFQDKTRIERWRKNIGEESANKITAAAKGKGTQFHSACEQYLLNNQDVMKGMFPDIKEMFLATKPVLDRIDNIYNLETQLFSNKLGLAGRTDCIAEFDGTYSVIDFKTANYTKESEEIEHYFEQESLYAALYRDMGCYLPRQLIIIMVGNDQIMPTVYSRATYTYIHKALDKVNQWKEIHDVS
jgi:hypothetical protein